MMLYFFVLHYFIVVISIVVLRGANAIFYNDSENHARRGACRLRTVRQAVDSPSGRSMTESFVLDDVEYKLCRYHVTWDEALVFCSTHKAHLATLDNDEKTSFVAQAIASSSNSISEDYWIGARKYYGGLWTWDSSAKRLGAQTDIISNIPISYPGDETNDVHCLTIDRRGHDSPIFVSRACHQRRGFICQRDNERAFDNKLRMVAATRIGEQEFRLYSGRATWAEAVVQCRQDGLQIGEVKTVEEARALAVSMLRNRPEGIESAWIGGYTRKNDMDTWRWLASGEKIENSEMWRRNLTESSGGCLMLDRHLCEIPVYVEITCDRKRDVLCQKPAPKKRLSKIPVEAIVDGCSYWIGYYPMKWSEARRSCDSVDASLVVLDSPKTIAHMMSLMLDNREELRHIWTDGRRTRKYGQWQWQVNGEAIPNFGESFVPWCSDDYLNANETDCLNLDRENLDFPLVYGLSCYEKQPYVCQPRIGNCVSHSSPVKTTDILSSEITRVTKFETPPSFYENTDTLGDSKITGIYPFDVENYMRITTSMDETRNKIDNIHHWKPGESISSKNSTYGHRFVNYFKPLSGFTLPSLPQFGVKVASAYEITTQLNYENRKTKKIKQLLASAAPPFKITTASTIVTSSLKKIHLEPRKGPQVSIKHSNFSFFPLHHDGYVEPTTIVNSQTTKYSKMIAKKFSSSLETKNFTKIRKIMNTPEFTFSSLNNENDGTNKYSVKTTRDLNSNVTKIITTASTTKNPNYPTEIDKGITIIPTASMEISRETKIEKFSRNSLIRITTPLSIKRKKLRFTTEFTTPYDAIDEDYYENDGTEKTMKNDDTSNDEFDEYDENYDSPEEFRNKKRIKQTSTSSIRKSYTTARSTKPVRVTKKKNNHKIPIAEELSKNLEIALVNMIKKGVQTRKMESTDEVVKSTSTTTATTTTTEETKIFSAETPVDNHNYERSARNNTENSSLRPYYAFEGPMIVGFAEDSNVGTSAEKIEFSGKVRQFKIIGKKINEHFPYDDKFASRRFHEINEQRGSFREPLHERNTMNNIPMDISGLPTIKPNDPNSLMQMGRYFKNKFGNIVANEGGRIFGKNGRDELAEYSKNERNDKTSLPPGRFQARVGAIKNRGYTINDEYRRNAGQRWENSDNYESTRRLYPRGYHDSLIPLFLPRGGEKNLEKSWQEEHERLIISWPERNLTNTNTLNFDEFVSPRNFPAPIRTTRSFNDDTKIVKIQRSVAAFPDFEISRLVKEVKIDLDQRLLRKYLEAFARKIVRKDNLRYKKNDWKDTWRYILEQMSRILDRMNINVNGDAMKVRVGSDSTKKTRDIVDSRKTVWKTNFLRQSKILKNRATMKNILRRKMMNINGTTSLRNSKKLSDNHRVSSGSLEKTSSNEIHSKNRQTTDNYETYSAEHLIEKKLQKKVDMEKSSLEREKIREKMKYPQTGSSAKYDDKTIEKSRIFFSNNYEATSRRTTAGDNSILRRFGNERRMENWYQTKYTNFNNSRILVAPTIIPAPGISRIYRYQPLVRQLHNRILYNQGLSQLHPIKRINSVSEKSTILNGEYLPKGILSRIVGSEYKNQHFGESKNHYFDNFTISGKKNYFNDENENSTNDDNKDFVKLSKINDAMENRDFNYYVNDNETNYDKIDDEFIDEENENDETYSRQDYSPKILLSSAHRLGKALELSNFRKFGQNLMNYLPTKNLVTRSLRSNEIFENFEKSKNRGRKYDRGRDDIVRNLENLNEEPSTVSLRMILNPNARISRQSSDSTDILKNPAKTVQLLFRFSGSEKKSNFLDKKIYSNYYDNLRKNIGNFSSTGNRTLNEPNKFFDRTGIKLPIRFIDKIRRRAMINKLRERKRVFIMKNYPLVWKAENVSKILNPRDRISRTVRIGDNGKNNGKSSVEEKRINNLSGTRQYFATSLRSFEDKNLTIKRHFRDNENGVKNRREPDASLFTDLRENDDQITLYVDLKLGRVGANSQKSEKSKT